MREKKHHITLDFGQFYASLSFVFLLWDELGEVRLHQSNLGVHELQSPKKQLYRSKCE